MSPAKSAKLEDQAAKAALYVTKGKSDKSEKPSNYPLDADGKLSSASAATSLKHAQPQDLPAYPIVGLQNTESSAGAAASLANANQKSVEYWKPGEIPEANKAAYSAKDYKPEPIWQPDLGPAGSKAALQAHKGGGEVKVWRPSDTDAGHSAAEQAMRKKGLVPQVKRGPTAEGEKRALMAAKGAVSGSRKRSDSTPVTSNSYPDSNNSAANALKAATSANRPSKTSQAPVASAHPSINAGRIHNQAVTNLSREMYTSHPPVAPETEEKTRQDTLHAAAVSMAKKMYDVQQKQKEEAAALRRSDSQYAANAVGERPQSSTSSSAGTEPPRYANLEDAAKRLASERLAKLHDEHAAYRTYYGTERTPSKRMSLRGRRRASSEGEAGDSDQEKSRQIRSQMSLFNDKLAQVDNKKRKQDRDSLLAAAQRNVRANMTAQDERVFNETGKVSPAMMAEWEAKANAKAQSDSQARMVNHGMVNIGGGKFIDQSEVDAIAAAKVRPTLDDITETAEKHRERDEELRQQQLERERIAAEKSTDDKERSEKTKEEWRKFREEEKQEDRARKEAAKARKAEDRKQRDEEKRRTVLGKVKGIFSKDEPDDGNREALDKLEGRKDMIPEPTPYQEGQKSEGITTISAQPLSNTGATTQEAFATPVANTESTTVPPGVTPDPRADEIAKRVFAAPVVAGGSTSSGEGLVKTYTDVDPDPKSSTDDAVSKEEPQPAPAKQAAPPIKSPSVSSGQGQAAPPIKSASVSSGQRQAAPAIKSPSVSSGQGQAPPLAERIAPPPAAVQPTTETTVTGPSSPASPSKEKDGSKVSSWLKSKLARRSSKTAPSPSSDIKPTISSPKDPKVFVGGANLGAPDTSTTTTSSEPAGDSSMHEVAMAGKQAGPVDAPVVSPTSEPEEEEVQPSAMAPGAMAEEAGDGDESSSISSLSSDEDTRGRSNVRLADQIQQSEPIFGTTAATHDRPAASKEDSGPVFGTTTATHDRPAASKGDSGPLFGTTAVTHDRSSASKADIATESKDFAASDKQAASIAKTEESEEVRDEFDAAEVLEPPKKGVFGSSVGEGRKSDSPARDSKFIENL